MSSTDPPENSLPAPTVGALLRLAWLDFRRRLYDRVVSAGYGDLQPSHVLLFKYPTIEGLRPGELADHAGISKQGVNDLLRHLEASGYVELRTDRRDRRARRITLTARGKALMEYLYTASSEVSDELSQAVGRRRFESLRKTLVDLTSDQEPDGPPSI